MEPEKKSEEIKIVTLAEEQENKHYDEVYYQPYGGATSFAEFDTQQEALEYSYEVDRITDQLRGIIHNITCDDEMEADEKARAIQTAASDFRERVNAASVKELQAIKAGKRMNGEQRGRLRRIMDDLKGFMRWAEYDDEDEKKKDPKYSKEIDATFKVYKDKEGKQRWLSFSSNAFEDLEKELFTTKALEEAVEYADKMDERGPLLVYHVPSAEIGQCDYQAVVGRFLVESGTFDNTPLGNKAAEYFVNTDEEYQVSIGYTYQLGDEKDGQYDWLRIRERSVCPDGTAANPWTDFRTIGGKEVDEKKFAALKQIFGDELAQQVRESAEEKTKDLEGSVRYKTNEVTADDLSATIKAELEAMGIDPERSATVAGKVVGKYSASEDKKEENKEESKSEEKSEQPSSVLSSEQATQLAQLITDLSNKVDELGELGKTVASIQEEIKALKKSDDEKIAAMVTPRQALRVVPASDSDKNILDPDKIKEITGSSEENNQDINPASAFVQDLLSGRAVVSQ
jgi:hypothetical protein